MDEAFDYRAGPLLSPESTSPPCQGNCHVNARQLIGGRCVYGEEAIAAESAEIVQRSLAGEPHDEIGGGGRRFRSRRVLRGRARNAASGRRTWSNERRVVAVERGLHALDRARRGSPGGFCRSRPKIGAGDGSKE